MTKPLPFTESRVRRAIAAVREEGWHHYGASMRGGRGTAPPSGKGPRGRAPSRIALLSPTLTFLMSQLPVRCRRGPADAPSSSTPSHQKWLGRPHCR
jgi:hypothetical protein